MSAFDRFLREVDRHKMDFGMWKDTRPVVSPENRYEIRVFGADDVQFIERGVTAFEACAKAADRLADDG